MTIKRFFAKAVRIVRKIYLSPVYFYRRFVSPIKPRCCRFFPTCSVYFIEAVGEWGIFIGTFLGIRRIIRCNPYSKGGYDPVPKRKRKKKIL